MNQRPQQVSKARQNARPSHFDLPLLGLEVPSVTYFPRMVEQTGSSFRNSIFEKALEVSITCNLLGICIVRTIPKPFKNESTFCQTAIKIQAWRHQDRGPEGSGASWTNLGRLWKRLGPSWKRLGSVLEASWAVLDRKR